MTEHGWTRHGHRCCDQATGPRPHNIARCGGPVLCRACAADAAIRHAPASGSLSRPLAAPSIPGAYEAAIDYLGRHIDIDPDSNRWLLDDADVRGLAAAVGAAGVAAGRAQAAADIRAADQGLTCSTAGLGERCDCAAIEVIEEAAKIAGGEPR